jgi:TolB protein
LPILQRATSRRAVLSGAVAVLTASRASRAEQATNAPRQRVTKIALPDFTAASDDATDLARQITQTITDDLRSTGRFTLIDTTGQPTLDTDHVPQFDAWRTLGAECLVIGRIKMMPDGRLRAEFRIWDIAAGLQLSGAQYFTAPEQWRRVGHVIAGTVYERLVGEEHDFESRRD